MMKDSGGDERFAYFRTVNRLYDLGKLSPSLSGICLDLGAHVGAFSICVAERTRCTIHSYEPSPHNFATFMNVVRERRLENRVTGFCEALDEHMGTSCLYLSTDKWGEAHTLFGKSGDSASVTTVTPEIIFDRIDGIIPYCKSNCEGGEYWLLRYFRDNPSCLNRIERLCIEIHPDLFKEHELAEVIELLQWLILRKPDGLKIAFAQYAPELVSQTIKNDLMVNTL